MALQSLRSMRRIEARRTKASAFRFKFSQSLARRRQRLSQAIVLSTIHRFGRTTKLLAALERLTISSLTRRRTRFSAVLNFGPWSGLFNALYCVRRAPLKRLDSCHEMIFPPPFGADFDLSNINGLG